ncbi:MAG: glycosyltransferase family 4 protein [Lachnospiraceae bacterium]|nr:glycosyltransferase family 4 protein [Lachnospiraceae bacterium]
MTITFVSNYINHHQIPMAEELYKALGDDYRFVETEPMETERVSMGWDSDTASLPYVIRYYENPACAQLLIDDSDVVVFGGCDDESYIANRLREKKPVIRVSERLYKSGQWKAISPRGLIKKYKDHTSHREDPVIILCAGAYVPSDFSIIKAYPNKMYKWGYFPPATEENLSELFQLKEENKVTEILWAGRFIDWKHPDDAIEVAKRLKKDNISFHLTMVGGGDMEGQIKAEIAANNLQENITLEGYKKPEEVRQYMRKADIFLFTSDYLEGWGAVLNEAMNSGCAVVANSATGATPYLINFGNNGYAYKNGDIDELYRLTKRLAQDNDERRKLGANAYKTIDTTWNAKKAAEQIIRLSRMLTEDIGIPDPEDGPGSKANVIPVRKMWAAIQAKRV